MKTILVIDDEKSILDMFVLLLPLYGYQVLTAENGDAGLKVFMDQKPPVVFIDIKMPKMDGFAVLSKIKETEPKTQVILMTGHGDKDLAKQALTMHANDFIHKPFQEESLTEAIGRLEERLKKG